MFLKQSTAFTDRIGPFLDKTDGVTEEIGLTTAASAIFLSKAGGNFGAKNESTALSHDQDGWYVIIYDATDTDTVGLLKVLVQAPATHLPVWEYYEVLEEVIYDALFAASANAFAGAAGSTTLGVGVLDAAAIAADAITEAKIADDAIAAEHIAAAAFVAATFAAGAIDATAIADGAIDAATFAAGAINAAALAADAIDKFWDEAMVQTTGAPAITGSMRLFMQWWAALSRNKMLQTATTSTLRNDADAADLATSTVSDDGTTATRGEWST